MASNEMTQLRQLMQQMMQQQGMPKSGGKIDYRSLRQNIDMAASRQPIEANTIFAPDNFEGVAVELVTPATLTGDEIIFYIHGGGFMTQNALTSRGFASQLAAEAGLRVYTISYRLAPEHPHPAGVNDCLTVYQALLEKYPHTKIALIGDSAGANLALVTTINARKSGLCLPTSITLYSPPADFTDNIDHTKHSDTDFTLSSESLLDLIAAYCPDADLTDPTISPLYADYTGFPPMKIDSDSGEILVVDADLLAEKAQAAGVEVVYKKWDGTFHAFATTGKGTPESYQVLKETVQFMRAHFLA